MNNKEYQEGMKAGKIAVYNDDDLCVDWSVDKRATLSEQTLNYVIRLASGGQAIVSRKRPIGGGFRIVSSFNEKTTKFSELCSKRREIIKARVKSAAKRVGHSLSWRRELVWVYPDGIPEAYVVNYDECIPTFLRKIEEIQHSQLVSRKVWQSWF